MKKYNIEMKRWIGYLTMDGEPIYDKSIIVRTDKPSYLTKKEKETFSENDIYTGKIHWYDLETGKRTHEDNFDF